jgi:hypothetical protein
MSEIGLAGASLDQVWRPFRRQNTILQGQYPNVNVTMGCTCEAGKAIVRLQLDQLQADGTLANLQRPALLRDNLLASEPSGAIRATQPRASAAHSPGRLGEYALGPLQSLPDIPDRTPVDGQVGNRICSHFGAK